MIQTKNPAHMCKMCEEIVSADIDFCDYCALEVGFSFSTVSATPQLIHSFQTKTYGTRVALSDSDYEALYPGRSAADIELGTPIEWFGAILRYTGSDYSTRTN